MPEKAMVFAAGLGTRMRPLTITTPKPLVKVHGKFLLDYSIDLFKNSGIKKFVINTHYLADQVEKHIKNLKGIEVKISHEKELLETGGGVKKVLSEFGKESFFTLNSDVIVVDPQNKMLKKMADFFDPEKMDALLLLNPVKSSIGYEGFGDFDLASDFQLINPGVKSKKYVFTGLQILNPAIFNNSPSGAFSLNVFFKNSTLVDGRIHRIYGIVNEGGWLHIGTVEGIKLAERYLSR